MGVLLRLPQSQEAYAAYSERLFLPDVSEAPKLHSALTDSQFLDTISAPSSGKGGRKKAPKRTHDELIEISDESDEQEEAVPMQSVS